MNLLLVVGAGFLLLVVGTLLGRYYTPDRRPLQRAAEEGQAYVRSLVDVLDGKNDQAIHEISTALKQNTKTVEAYFALGTLFRQRKEYERAVRVHQTLLVRRDVDKKTCQKVHYQLALDFLAAGFPRRAIKALEYVVTQNSKDVAAHQDLARLYENTGDWERAILMQRRLGKLTRQNTTALQAHLLAEQASRALQQEDLSTVRKALKGALSLDAQSVHALHVLGRYQEQRGNHKAAVGAWEKALRLRPELATFFTPLLEQMFFELDRVADYERLLQELRQAHPGQVQLRLAHARWDAKRNPERALISLEALINDYPALLPARREAARLVIESGDVERIHRAFTELLTLLAQADQGYRCNHCGHTGAVLFWHCPSCSYWDSARVAWGRRTGEAT
jgi:lipopolysaccharide assembly protein B